MTDLEKFAAALFTAAEEAGHFILAYATGQEIDLVLLSLTERSKVRVLFDPGLQKTPAAVALAGKMGVEAVFTSLDVKKAGLVSEPDMLLVEENGGEDEDLRQYVKEALEDWRKEFFDVVTFFLMILVSLKENASVTFTGDQILEAMGLREKECGV